MRIIADLHLHSRYSRACSPDLSIASLEAGARRKGIDLLGTGDFQHPDWMAEIERELSEDSSGILRTPAGFPFVLTTELSLVYTDQGKTRKIHLLVWAPSLSIAKRVQKLLLSWGRIDYDGRPTFGRSCEELVLSLKDVSERIEVIPAHAWTPWFGILGRNGGYDSIETAFGNAAKHVHAIETGLSSDPQMNRRLSGLDRFELVSFSDAHSAQAWRLGREATMFDLDEVTYDAVIDAVRTGKGLTGTIEVDPAYGKYHYDGHRSCSVSLTPDEAEQVSGLCPVCGRALTMGVEHRVHELADRTNGESQRTVISILPLHELISIHTGTGISTKRVQTIYDALVPTLGSEFDVLLDVPLELIRDANSDVASIIEAARHGRIETTPGYDGVYGVASAPIGSNQKTLGSF